MSDSPLVSSQASAGPDPVPAEVPVPTEADQALVRSLALVDLIHKYRLANLQKKQAEATLDSLKPLLLPLLTVAPFKDEHGFAKIVPASESLPAVSAENALVLQNMAKEWSKSEDPFLVAASVSVLALIEMKNKASYVLVK